MPTSIAWPRVGFMKEYWIIIVIQNVEHQLELIDLTNFCFDASLIFSQFLRSEYHNLILEKIIDIYNTNLIGICYKSSYVLWLFYFLQCPSKKAH